MVSFEWTNAIEILFQSDNLFFHSFLYHRQFIGLIEIMMLHYPLSLCPLGSTKTKHLNKRPLFQFDCIFTETHTNTLPT